MLRLSSEGQEDEDKVTEIGEPSGRYMARVMSKEADISGSIFLGWMGWVLVSSSPRKNDITTIKN